MQVLNAWFWDRSLEQYLYSVEIHFSGEHLGATELELQQVLL